MYAIHRALPEYNIDIPKRNAELIDLMFTHPTKASLPLPIAAIFFFFFFFFFVKSL